MTIAELKTKSTEELDAYFASMPEPTHKKTINTNTLSMDEIIRNFEASTVSKEDRGLLQDDLINLS
jgi:hypothetical protein